MTVNKVILVGRLGRDPEVRVTGSGVTVATFSLATDSAIRRSGQCETETEWHRIVAYDRVAEVCRDHLAKGALIYLEGRLKTREWENREGRKQKTTEIIIERMCMLGGKERSDRSAASAWQQDSVHEYHGTGISSGKEEP